MIDFIKAISETPEKVNELYSYAINNLQRHKPQNNYYLAFSNGSGRFRIEFRKVVLNGELIGFRNVEVCFSPHYYFNNDLHNGNDFSPIQCINVVSKFFRELGQNKLDLSDFIVVNIEYGLNLKVESASNIVNSIFYTKRTPFITNHIPCYKISNSTKYKQIKAYDKGAQFRNFPQYGIKEIFRFEIKAKQRKMIKNLGINNILNLLELKTYFKLFNSILKEWENILVVDKTQNLGQKNNVKYWDKIVNLNNRNRFRNEKQKLYKKLSKNDNLHTQIKLKIQAKFFEFFGCAFSTLRNPMNKGNFEILNFISD